MLTGHVATTCVEPLVFLQVCEKAPFLDGPRRIMSKLWKLLRCTNWCILSGDMCFRCQRTNFRLSGVPASLVPSAITAVLRCGQLFDPWRCVGIVPSDHGVVRDSLCVFRVSCSSSFAEECDMWAHCSSRPRHIQKARKKNKIDKTH